MNVKYLLKNTAIYGLATILPRIINLVLTPLHISNLQKSDYGIYQSIFAYMIMGNVLLTYGMETAFFRFINKESNKNLVSKTALTSIVVSTLAFCILTLPFASQIAHFLDYRTKYIIYAILILALDTLSAIPFAWYRNQGKSANYSLIKVANVLITLLFNLFFFYLTPNLLSDKVEYVFISNLIASALTLLFLANIYLKIGFGFSLPLFKSMFHYGFYILLAGIAFSINEAFDRIFIREMYPKETANAVVGIYSACYKMGVFMNLFITAYKLGVEPLFFSLSNEKNKEQSYSQIMEIFIVFASFILLFICVYADIFKLILIPNSTYWEALWIVPFVLMGNMFLGIYHNLSAWYKVSDNTIYGAYISFLGGIITIVANFTLIPVMGYKGAAVATLLAYFSMAAASYFIGQKKFYIPYPMTKIYTYLLSSIVLSILNFYVFDRNLFSGTLSLLIFLVLVIYLNKNILSNIKIKSISSLRKK